jgi:hypothetical protein
LWHYNTRRKTKRRLTYGTSYFTPALSDNLQIAVSKKHLSGEQSVVLLDSLFLETEIIRFRLGASVNDIAWVDNENLAVLYTAAQGMSIGVVNVRSGQMETLLPFTFSEISDLSAHDGKVFFVSGYDGISNIYAVNVQRKSVYKLTSAAYGAFSPRMNFDGSKLLYIDYSPRGGKPAALPMSGLLWEETSFDTPCKFPLAEAIARQERFVLDTVTLDTAPLEVKKYGKLAHLFRFHSWTPFHFSPDNFMNGDFLSAAVGVTLLSQNNLSTAVTELGYKYSQGFSSVNAVFTYVGWFPAVELSGSYGSRYNAYYDLYNQKKRYGNELYGELNLTTYLPLNFSSGNLRRALVPYVQLHANNDQISTRASLSYAPELSVNAGFSAQVATRMAQRDIHPRWGATVAMNLQSAFAVDKLDQKMSVSGLAYAPGIFPNHSVRLYAGYEEQQRPLLYSTRLAAPRGFAFEGGLAAPVMHSLSASYALPLCYPDFSAGGLAYLKRIRVNAFADYMAAFDGVALADFTGAGYEAVLDFHLLRFPVLINAGWRQTFTRSYMRNGKPPKTLPVEVLVSVSF